MERLHVAGAAVDVLNHATATVQHTTCCIVGGGPAGMILGLLLARRGIPVTVLEAHKNFDRDFRGDTLHPAILEVLDQVGLAAALHELPHVKMYGPSLITTRGAIPIMDFTRLKTRFPYIMLMTQKRFLQFLAAEAAKYAHFQLIMGARVSQLMEEGADTRANAVVRGVRYQIGGEETVHEVHAVLTIGADGRFSRIRQLARIEAVQKSPPMELLWFRLEREPNDGEQFELPQSAGAGKPFAIMNGDSKTPAMLIYRGDGFLLMLMNRLDHWQVGYIYVPGSYQAMKVAGISAFRSSVLVVEPRLARHLDTLADWRQLSPLSVAFSRCRKWFKPGLLLIGDAAHVMTPAAGSGIKYAIEDAVEVANVLSGGLLAGHVTTRDLARVQRRRACSAVALCTYGSFRRWPACNSEQFCRRPSAEGVRSPRRPPYRSCCA